MAFLPSRSIKNQPGDALEVPLILRDKGKCVMKGSGGNENIRIANDLPLLAQSPADNGKLVGNLARNGEYSNST